MIRRDLHCHTRFCDGSNTPEEMVRAALDKGLSTLGISSHSYTFFDTSYCMSKEGVLCYLDEMAALKERYQDKIELLCGVEQDCYSDYPTDRFDYVIGSVHYIRCNGTYIPIDETPALLIDTANRYFCGDLYALCEQYYDTVSTVVERTGCDIIGHLDLVTKFNEGGRLFDEQHPRYIAAWQNAVDRLLTYSRPFEINTGAISRGYRTSPYPSREIAAYIRRRGGTLVLSSDAHRAEDLGSHFDTYESWLS